MRGVQRGGKDERVQHEKIGRRRIAVGDAVLSPPRAHFDSPPFLRPATHVKLRRKEERPWERVQQKIEKMLFI